MGIAQYGSLVLMLALWGTARLQAGRFLARKRMGWWWAATLVLIMGLATYHTYAQFIAWKGDVISQYLLPPHAPAWYFARYAFVHFWSSYALSGALALLVFWAAWLLNKKFSERFFEPEELHFLALGIFLTGHPGWIMYILVMVVLALSLHFLTLIRGIYTKTLNPYRVSLYHFWLPMAAIAILISSYLGQVGWYSSLLL